MGHAWGIAWGYCISDREIIAMRYVAGWLVGTRKLATLVNLDLSIEFQEDLISAWSIFNFESFVTF